MEDNDLMFTKIDLSPEELKEDILTELEKSAQDGNHESQSKIAYCYQYGLGVKKDLKKAFDWYTQAAEGLIPEALCNLGAFYLNGIATTMNFNKAFELFTKAAELDNVVAQRFLAEIYISIFKDAEAAIYWWQRAADQNDENSITWLASAYKNGLGHIKKDYKKARELYQKAAELGSAIAADNLGYFYQEGLGGEKNTQEAIHWFEKAVKQDLPTAKYNLALLYKNGFLFCHPACRKKVISLLIEAATQGLDDAVRELVRIYNNPNILERKDIDINWLQKMIDRVNNKDNFSSPGLTYTTEHTGKLNI